MVPAVRLLRRRQLRAAHRGQPPHSRRGDRDEEVLPDRRPADCGVRGGVQPDTQRQDAGRRVQPGQGALPHLRRGRSLRRRGGPEARPNARGRGADPRQDEKLLPNPLGGRAHRRPERTAAPREAEPVLLGRGRRERRAHDEGLRVPLLPRLQARRQRLLLQIRRHVVPGPRARQVRQRAVGPLPRRHHRPAGPPRDHPPRPGHGQVEGGRLREEADRMDGQGDHRRADGGGQEGVRLPDTALRAQILEGGGGGPARPSPEQEPEALRLHGARVHVRADEGGARRAGDADRVDGAAQLDRGGRPRLPPARGPELHPSPRAQPRRGFPDDDHRTGGHTEALRDAGALARGRRLLRAEQAIFEPRPMQPEEACEPHGLRRRQARIGEVVLRQARDREHHPRVPRGRDHRPRPRRRVFPRGRGERRGVHTVRPRRGHAPQPVRPLRRRTPVALRPDGLQDRRLPGVVQRDHGRGGPGAPGGRQVHHQPLRRAGIPRRGRGGAHPPSRGLPPHPESAARAGGPGHTSATWRALSPSSTALRT